MPTQATQPSPPPLSHTYRSEIGRRLANRDGGRRVNDRAHLAGHCRGSGTGRGGGQGRGRHKGPTEQSTPGEAVKHHGGAAVVRCGWRMECAWVRGCVCVLLFDLCSVLETVAGSSRLLASRFRFCFKQPSFHSPFHHKQLPSAFAKLLALGPSA